MPKEKKQVIQYLPYLNTIKEKIKAGYERLVLMGGTRSGKSYQLAILMIQIAINPASVLSKKHIEQLEKEGRKGVFILIARQKQVDMDTTVRRDIYKILSDMKLYPENTVENELIKINKVKNFIEFKTSGSQIWFTGADREGRGMGAAPDICWFNEISEIREEFYQQIYMRMRMFSLFDCNPKMGERHWARTKLLISESSTPEDGGVYVHRSTFRDNKFLPINQVKRYLSYEPTPENIAAGTADEYMWKVYGLGVFAIKEGLVFTEMKDWDYIEDDEFPKDCSWCWALDVGFKDQTAFGRIGIKEGCIYIDEYIYESGLSVATPVEAPGKDSLVKRLQAIGVKRGDVIIYDSASASTGDTLITCGYNAIPCRKEGGGKASIVPQIAEMKNYHIRTTRRSVGWIGEVAEYAWNKKEPDGKPIGTNGDHSIDMSRYGATYLILSGGRSRKTQGGRTARRFAWGCEDKQF